METFSSDLFLESERHQLDIFFNELDDTNQEFEKLKSTPVILSSPMNPNNTFSHNNGMNYNIDEFNSTLFTKNNDKTNMKSPNAKKSVKKQGKKSGVSNISPSSSSNEDNEAGQKLKKYTRSRKAAHELLSEEQKRVNHIASEQRRRANIRVGYDKLIDIVPTLNNGSKSEALILQKSVEYLKQLLESKTVLKERARSLQLALGEMPDVDSSDDEMSHHF